jgi:hypothetical protein
MAPPPVTRQRCHSEPVLSANRPPFPKLDPAPVARTSVLAPFTLTRLPVPSFRWRLRTEGSSGAVGVPPWPRPVPRCPWPPASRWLGASKRCPAARRSGCPVLVAGGAAPPLAAPVARCSSLRSVASRPVRSRLRLVNQSRFPLPSARRLRSEDPVIRFRLACAPRYVAYLRERITPGQGVFLNPQGYPLNFFFNPQKCSSRPPFMHRDVPKSTGSSRGFVDGSHVIRLNGRRWRISMTPTRPPSRSSTSQSLRRARGDPTCSSSRPRAAFLLPDSGHRPKEK